MENEDSLAVSLIKEQAKSNKRMFILIIILIVALFVSNMAWLYVFQSYDYVTETVEQDAGDGGNASYIKGNGDINNGETKNNN